MEKEIEIPFGAKDSELKGWEYTIPENMEAEIKDGKIIVKQKESEDERIRKSIVETIKQCPDTFLNPKNRDRMLAYLERQKERGHLSKDEEYKLARIIEYLEDNDCPSEWKDLLHDVYSLPYQKGQQPAEWSEEDEKALDSVLSSGKTVLTESNRKWLKSLPERFNLQPKYEWSEEDERRFISCMGKLQTADGSPTSNSDWFEEHCYKHSSWKPSKEQMKALKEAADEHWEPDGLHPLYTLYTDLQKLP